MRGGTRGAAPTPVQWDSLKLYEVMLRSRAFEEAVATLWDAGEISGEMHLGLGEEAIAAGVVAHLREGDSMALDHRATPPMLARGVDAVPLLKEMLGRADGLCGGCGGHMHLFSAEHRIASSGIVGAAGPTAAGFALGAQHRKAGEVAVAFFGDGAMNQGMLLESMNLASAWRLPVVFVCKDNDWAITTKSSTVTGGDLEVRARGLGLAVETADGSDVEAVVEAAGRAVERAREEGRPTFLHARCVHLEGHMLGDPLVRLTRRPVQEMKEILGPLMRSATASQGASLVERLASVGTITSLLGKSRADDHRKEADPLRKQRRRITGTPQLEELERRVEAETKAIVERAVAE